MTQQTLPPTERRPVVLAGGSQFVQDQVARACAAAGVTPHFAPDLAQALPLEPAVLLLGADQAVGGMPGHREVIVVGAADDEARAWTAAATVASSRVVIVPQGAGWLAEHLGRRLNPAASGAVVGFLGAAGGAGVSTFAFWCARHAADLGTSTLLVDGHPLGGGLDLALGIEERPGVRWHDLRDLRGTLNVEQLAAALPAEGRLAVLSHAAHPDAAGPHPGHGMESAAAVLDAARGAFELSVVDLGSAGSAAIQALVPLCDQLVLLVPSRPRSAVAVARILEAHGSLPTTVVLRGPVLDGLDAWLVADLAGRPGPLPYLPFVRGSSTAEATGRMLDFPLPRRARKLVESVVAGLEVAA
ncbi:septum site-determining protein Ssd [Arthrobacter sp. Ld5]|uniref:septum site-determining protein Ssd n=1 Tax=Arthrobacter sp. Ld5 TaxID=649152 RepID=UPI003EBFB0EF